VTGAFSESQNGCAVPDVTATAKFVCIAVSMSSVRSHWLFCVMIYAVVATVVAPDIISAFTSVWVTISMPACCRSRPPPFASSTSGYSCSDRPADGSEIGAAKVMGILELDGDRIVAWRDYFDVSLIRKIANG
jgi:hypothetical protein